MLQLHELCFTVGSPVCGPEEDNHGSFWPANGVEVSHRAILVGRLKKRDLLSNFGSCAKLRRRQIFAPSLRLLSRKSWITGQPSCKCKAPVDQFPRSIRYHVFSSPPWPVFRSIHALSRHSEIIQERTLLRKMPRAHTLLCLSHMLRHVHRRRPGVQGDRKTPGMQGLPPSSVWRDTPCSSPTMK